MEKIMNKLKRRRDSMKNLIIGAFSGYKYNQLKPWVESIIEVMDPNVEKVMIVGNTNEETKNILKEKGFTIFEMAPTPNLPPHIPRWIHVYDYLKQHGDKYNNVIMTDLKDVYFQTDPFVWLEENLGDKKIVTGSECLLYRDESWGNQNLIDTFGTYLHEQFKDCEIYNVGILGGKPEYLRDLFLHNYLLALRIPSALDQGTFNLLMHTHPYKDIVLFAKQKDGWACQAGTVADPSKMETFRPNLLEPEPIYKDNIVYTSTGKPFAIVHQYDRVPEWKNYISKKYNQDKPEDYFTYRTI
jgi:hypothetical protein